MTDESCLEISPPASMNWGSPPIELFSMKFTNPPSQAGNA